jgi:hypothetical protein
LTAVCSTIPFFWDMTLRHLFSVPNIRNAMPSSPKRQEFREKILVCKTFWAGARPVPEYDKTNTRETHI